MGKPFVYLAQSPGALSDELLSNIPSDQSDLFVLTFETELLDQNHLYRPGSTWTEGRNTLLSTAFQNQYLYYIFLDDDIELSLSKESGCDPEANPFRVFEDCLMRYEPAVGVVQYDDALALDLDLSKEVQTLYWFDALFNAFHHQTIGTLLPYYAGLDFQSWYYSQNLLIHTSAQLYPSHTCQFNQLEVINTQNRASAHYKREHNLEVPEQFYLESLLTKDSRFKPEKSYRGSEHHKFKTKDTNYDQIEIASTYDLEHPYWRDKLKKMSLLGSNQL